jgi:hypothetical protein
MAAMNEGLGNGTARRSAPHSAQHVIDDLGPACARIEARLGEGHHVLGEMLAARPGELAEVTQRFLKIANELTRRLNWLDTLLRDDAHPSGWLDPMLVRVRTHPLAEWLRSPPAAADEAIAPLARGTAPPFAQLAADLPPIAVCAGFLDEVATVLAQTRREAIAP